MLLGHGDDGYRYGQNIVADFSTNVWYGGEPAGLKEYVINSWQDVNRYPEVISESLQHLIATHHHLPESYIQISSGTTESIYQLAQLFATKRTTIVIPAFSEYEDACSIFDHQLEFMSWEDSLRLPRIRSEVVFICNPNNPTGQHFHDLEQWVRKNPACLFIVDEAFIDFAPDAVSLIDQIERFDNLVIMRSLTKAYAIPGLRLGYIVSQPYNIEQLLRIKQPWTVNALALVAGKFIFENYTSVQPPVEQLISDRNVFLQQLKVNDSCDFQETSTHFLLGKTNVRNAAQLKTFLIEKYGILIRDAGNFRGLSRQHFRIATLSAEKNLLLVEALSEWKNLYY